MKAPLKYSMLALGLLASGALRGVWERPVKREFLAAGLLDAPVGIGTRDRIGQTSSAVALGGLRTLVATFLNLRAFTFFTEGRWDDVADTYDIIVDLAPHTSYYWDAGAWHSAYNASHYYRWDAGLPPLRAKAAWQASVLRGRAFFERGIRNNPGDWQLEKALGQLLGDSEKLPDYPAAAEAYAAAAATGKAPPWVKHFILYNLIRAPGREAEALALARKLFADRHNRVTGVMTALYVLEQRADPKGSAEERAIRIFGSPEAAYRGLSGYWQFGHDYPMDGVPAALKPLEKRLNIPATQSIFRNVGPRIERQDLWLRKPTPLEDDPSEDNAPRKPVGR